MMQQRIQEVDEINRQAISTARKDVQNLYRRVKIHFYFILGTPNKGTPNNRTYFLNNELFLIWTTHCICYLAFLLLIDFYGNLIELLQFLVQCLNATFDVF